jgi:hypothetical protein
MTLDKETESIQNKIFDWLIEENYNPVPRKDITENNDFLLHIPLPIVNGFRYYKAPIIQKNSRRS